MKLPGRSWDWRKFFLWCLASSVPFACFWGLCFAATGRVPAVEKIIIWRGEAVNLSVQLPFAVSRWYDVLIGPLIVLILSLTSRDIGNSPDNGSAFIAPGKKFRNLSQEFPFHVCFFSSLLWGVMCGVFLAWAGGFAGFACALLVCLFIGIFLWFIGNFI